MSEHVRVEATGDGLLEIVLDRGEPGNALTPEMADAIVAAMKEPGGETRAILLRGESLDFCTGRAPVLPKSGTRVTALDLRRRVSDPVLDFYDAIRKAPVPVIAAVQGHAAGVGCAIAVLADVTVAAGDARFTVLEMDRDIAPTLVMDALCDRLGRAAFARLVLTQDAVGANEAKMLGLIGVVAEKPVAEARRITERLCANSPSTVRAVKAFLAKAPESSHDTRRELAALLNAVALAERFRLRDTDFGSVRLLLA